MEVGALLKSVNFAAQKHQWQRRKNAEGTPYINHPVGVAWVLFHEGGVTDVAVLEAAVLHDTVEDTETTFEELEAEFGEHVASIVRECSDDKSLEKQERKRLQIEHAAHATPQAKLVKLGDKIYNLRDLQKEAPVGWSSERVLEYFAWAKKVTDNCRGINAKLDGILEEIYKQGPTSQ